MDQFLPRPVPVNAVVWQPELKDGSVGYDRHGIEYTVTENGLQVPGRGFQRIHPGDVLVMHADGSKEILTVDQFGRRYRPVDERNPRP